MRTNDDILIRRATELARPLSARETPNFELLSWSINEEHFALTLSVIAAVIRTPHLVSLPRAIADRVAALVLFRDKFLPVALFPGTLRQSPARAQWPRFLLVVEQTAGTFCLFADDVRLMKAESFVGSSEISDDTNEFAIALAPTGEALLHAGMMAAKFSQEELPR